MIGVKKLAAGVVLFMMVIIAQVAFAADQDPAVLLKQLDKDLRAASTDMKDKLANFDKAGSTVTTAKENVAGMQLDVTIYKDKNGNILKIYKDPNGKDAQVKLISAGNGPVLTLSYNPDGSIAKEEIFEPFGLKKETITYNPDGTKTVVVQDASLATTNTLTYQEDKNGNVVPGSMALSTTPGLPPGAIYCQTTGQYQEAKPA
jgi:hypothetical protein